MEKAHPPNSTTASTLALTQSLTQTGSSYNSGVNEGELTNKKAQDSF